VRARRVSDLDVIERRFRDCVQTKLIADANNEANPELMRLALKLAKRPIKAVLEPYSPVGSTAHVRFNTSRTDRWETNGPPHKCRVNRVMFDSDWEGEFCRVAESHPRVDDGHGEEDLLNLIVESKG
jgi:hypothetical protein